MQNRRISIILAAALMLAADAPVHAELITMQMGGEITRSDDPVLTGIEVGQTWMVTYTFDSNTPDLATFPGEGQYDKISDSVIIGGRSLAIASSGRINVRNDSMDPVQDRYSQGASLSPFGLSDWPALSVALEDDNATVFSDDSLPLAPLPLSEFESLTFKIGDALSYSYEVRGTVTYWTPEPTSLSLLAVGGLLLLRRRKWPSHI
jgi:hypothetical protein